jgi:hypothetical protein
MLEAEEDIIQSTGNLLSHRDHYSKCAILMQELNGDHQSRIQVSRFVEVDRT